MRVHGSSGDRDRLPTEVAVSYDAKTLNSARFRPVYIESWELDRSDGSSL